MRFEVSIAGKQRVVGILLAGSSWECSVDGEPLQFDLVQLDQHRLSILFRGKSYDVRRGGNDNVLVNGVPFQVEVVDARSWNSKRRAVHAEQGPLKLIAAMPGKILRLLAKVGDVIQAGQGVAVVEAMKMQNEVRSPRAGVLRQVLAQQGANINAGEVLAIID